MRNRGVFLSFEMTELTTAEKEKIIHYGSVAERVLSDTEIMMFFEELKDTLKNYIVTTSQEMAQEREHAYLRYITVDDTIGFMKTFVDAKANLVKAADLDEEEERGYTD